MLAVSVWRCRFVSLAQTALSQFPREPLPWNAGPCLQTQEKEILHWGNSIHLVHVRSCVGHTPYPLASSTYAQSYILFCLISQKLHLPPELSETVSRAQEDQDPQGKRKTVSLLTSAVVSKSTESRSTVPGVGRRIGATADAPSEGQYNRTHAGVLPSSRTSGGGPAGPTGRLSSHNIDFWNESSHMHAVCYGRNNIWLCVLPKPNICIAMALRININPHAHNLLSAWGTCAQHVSMAIQHISAYKVGLVQCTCTTLLYCNHLKNWSKAFSTMSIMHVVLIITLWMIKIQVSFSQ